MLAGIVLLALPSAAQVEVGDAQMNLSGNVGVNYNGSIDQGVSSHGLGFTGDANLHGSYYSPNFLSFSVSPYYGRNQSNSVFGSLTDSGGVTAGVNLFSGSHFPGSFSYGKAVNSTGAYGVPGSSVGLATNGDDQEFAVSWSAHVPDWPTLTALYASDTTSESIYGLQEQSSETTRTFSLLSTYQVAGFRLAGGYSHVNFDGTLSELLGGGLEPVHSNSSNNNYHINAEHSFPMQGAYSVSYNHSNYDYGFQDPGSGSSSGATNTVNGNLNFRPLSKLSVGVNGNYYDNLLGSIPDTILNGGAGGNFANLGTFRGFLMGGNATYQVLSNLWVGATANHTEQTFLDQHYSVTQFAANVNYNMQRNLLKGLSFNLAAWDSATKEGNTVIGFVGNLNYHRKLAQWEVDGTFSYAQNVQTIVLFDTVSSLSWVANARRHIGNRSYLSAGYSGFHSGFSAQAGSSASAERVSGTLTYRTYSLNGFYSKSNGTAAYTTTGLVPLPGNLPPSVLPPGAVTSYDNKGYGFNASASLRHLYLNAGYAQSSGDTITPLLGVYAKNTFYNAVLQYRLRKIYVNGGYTHLSQSVGTLGTVPVVVTSYYIGISRWFNFF